MIMTDFFFLIIIIIIIILVTIIIIIIIIIDLLNLFYDTVSEFEQIKCLKEEWQWSIFAALNVFDISWTAWINVISMSEMKTGRVRNFRTFTSSLENTRNKVTTEAT